MAELNKKDVQNNKEEVPFAHYEARVRELDPEEAAARLVNLVTAWKHEIKEMMGGMGINSIEALRGNRVMLRGIHLNEKELEILGIAHAGE